MLRNMKRNDIVLFICNAPFQLLSAIQIRCHYFSERPAAVLLTDAAKALRGYAASPVLSEIFQQVFYGEIFTSVKTLPGYDNVEHFDERVRMAVHEQLPVIPCADVFFANLHGWIGYYLESLRANGFAHMGIHYYEDGMDSYIQKIGFSQGEISVEDMYVYDPACIVPREGNPERAYAIPAPQTIPAQAQDAVKRLFGFDDVAAHLKKFIFFEQHSDSKDDYPALDQLFCFVHTHCHGQAVLKSHPRRRYHPPELDAFRWETNIPWEVIAANEPLNDYVLVSVSSKAVFSMTNVSTSRPPVILLHHLIRNMTGKPLQWWHMDDGHVDTWRQKYGADRVFIPETFEALQQIILKLSTSM